MENTRTQETCCLVEPHQDYLMGITMSIPLYHVNLESISFKYSRFWKGLLPKDLQQWSYNEGKDGRDLCVYKLQLWCQLHNRTYGWHLDSLLFHLILHCSRFVHGNDLDGGHENVCSYYNMDNNYRGPTIGRCINLPPVHNGHSQINGNWCLPWGCRKTL